jgi:uncharacterized membrane protein YdbT with pleckstrin-like domain
MTRRAVRARAQFDSGPGTRSPAGSSSPHFSCSGCWSALGYTGRFVWWAFVVIVPGSVFLAWDRFRGLGHALLPAWLVAQSGSLSRTRVVLATEGIIGWNIRRSFFQRRAGLATLIATTAAGRHRYSIPDILFDDVWPLIEQVNAQQAPAVPAGKSNSVR